MDEQTGPETDSQPVVQLASASPFPEYDPTHQFGRPSFFPRVSETSP